MIESDVGSEYASELGGCCPRRVTIIGLDDRFVHFQTRDFVKHQMLKEEFEAISYKVG